MLEEVTEEGTELTLLGLTAPFELKPSIMNGSMPMEDSGRVFPEEV